MKRLLVLALTLALSVSFLSSFALAHPMCVCECTPTPAPTATPTETPTPLPTATATAIPSATPTPIVGVSIPELARWESNMRTKGAAHCATLKAGGAWDPLLAATYYDAERVYYQVFEYTQDASWLSCAHAAESVYRDRYLIPNHGNLPGYWLFAKGLAIDYERSGDEQSKRAVQLLAQNGSYCRDWTPLPDTEDQHFSREVAYCIMTSLAYEDVGFPRRAKLSRLVDQALRHVDQWFVSQTASYTRPFMFGLTAQALIEYRERTGDARVLPALVNAADVLWARYWLPASQAFKYTNIDTRTLPPSHPAYNSGGTEPASDLNLLIAPVYGYLWAETGEVRFRDRFDAIFAGGVRGAYLENAKQWNQNYMWSFAGVAWRRSR